MTVLGKGYGTHLADVFVTAVIASETTTTSIPVPANACCIIMWKGFGTTGSFVELFCNISHTQAKMRLRSSIWGGLPEILLWVSIVEILTNSVVAHNFVILNDH